MAPKKKEVGMKRIFFCLLVTLSCLAALPLAADAGEKKETARGGYTLALFPIKVIAQWGEGYAYKTETLAAEGLANAAADDPLLELKYAYLKIGDSGDTLSLEDAAGEKDIDIWRQTSLLANFSPNWHQVKVVGSEITADLAILIRIRAEDSLLSISLYDFEKGKIYTKTSQGVYWGSMASGVQKIAEGLMQDFYDNQ
jgi:hypothetical protein